MPFGKDLAPSLLHHHRAHAEAAARIAWCVDERALGVLTGEVGAGKTVVARAALANLDTSRTVVYLGNPAVGARGLYAAIVTALGGVPPFHKDALVPQATDALAAEEAERGKRVVLVVDEAHLLDVDQLEEPRLLTRVDMDSRSPGAVLLVGQPTPAYQARRLRCSRPAHRVALLDGRHGPGRDRLLHRPPPQARRAGRHVVLRRRGRARRDVIFVELEHREGVAVAVVRPYQRPRLLRRTTYGELEAKSWRARIWTDVEPAS